MAVDIFLEIDDVKGEARDAQHSGKMEILSWGLSAEQSAATTGQGRGSGKVKMNDITLAKYMDKASARLFSACCKGTHFKQAVLIERKSGGTPLEYLKVTLKDVMVTSYTTIGHDGADRRIENLSLSFGEIHTEYTPQKADGSGEASILVGWDITRNTEV